MERRRRLLTEGVEALPCVRTPRRLGCEAKPSIGLGLLGLALFIPAYGV